MGQGSRGRQGTGEVKPELSKTKHTNDSTPAHQQLREGGLKINQQVTGVSSE